MLRTFFGNTAYNGKISSLNSISLRKQWADITTGTGPVIWTLIVPAAGYSLYLKEKRYLRGQ
jgi:hypothetical protein